MKATTKSHLAAEAGVSLSNLSRWLLTKEAALLPMGYRRNMRLLPPHIANYIRREYGIVDENA